MSDDADYDVALAVPNVRILLLEFRDVDQTAPSATLCGGKSKNRIISDFAIFGEIFSGG